jgi:hypothetical protein
VPAWAAEPPPATETVIRITADAAPEPRPALRYRLLPELRDMQPGNPIPGYMKCFMEQQHFFFNKESVANREKYLTMPLGELPLGELRNYGGSALRQADWAARLQTPDWQTLIPLRNAGIGLLIPEVQQMRSLATALKVRFRAQVAQRRFDDAVKTAQTMFALARHLGEHPTLVGDLVGLAIANVAIGPVDEMIGQPGCPNLYWALTDLPAPLVELRKGIEGDRVMMAYELSWLDESAPMDAERLERAYNRFQLLLGLSEGGPGPRINVRDFVRERVQNEDGVRAARERLVAGGLHAEQVKHFPPAQVVLLDEKRAAEASHQDAGKIMLLPYWQAEAYLARRPLIRPTGTLFGVIASDTFKVRRAQARLEQRLALLRVVEALRLHAAEHGGTLPGSLEEIVLPLPVDPITGRPFPYKLDGDTGAVQGTPPPGQVGPVWKVRYELTIRK